jgi:hypothetical protein
MASVMAIAPAPLPVEALALELAEQAMLAAAVWGWRTLPRDAATAAWAMLPFRHLLHYYGQLRCKG